MPGFACLLRLLPTDIGCGAVILPKKVLTYSFLSAMELVVARGLILNAKQLLKPSPSTLNPQPTWQRRLAGCIWAFSICMF